jgi:hypothetical protein
VCVHRQGTDRKLNRYSSAISSIKNLLLWWDGLTAVDQASQLNISRFVTAGESIRIGEVQAWADANRDADKSSNFGQDSASSLEIQQVDNPMFEG